METTNTTIGAIKQALGLDSMSFAESTKNPNTNLRFCFSKEKSIFFQISANTIKGIQSNPEVKLDVIALPKKGGSAWSGYEIVFAGSVQSRVTL